MFQHGKRKRVTQVMANRTERILCPVCGNKTHTMMREDTEIKNFPLYCPKCKKESLVDVKKMVVVVHGENDK